MKRFCFCDNSGFFAFWGRKKYLKNFFEWFIR